MIGIFDSGSGGLTVLAAIRRQAPDVDVVYFGDIANMPYGGRSLNELEVLTTAAIDFLRVNGATYIVSACNSISAAVVRPRLVQNLVTDFRITEMVGPAVAAVREIACKKVVLLATAATVSSGMYQQAFLEAGISIDAIAIPGLADAIEFERNDQVVEIILEVAKTVKTMEPRVVILACTHYPLVINTFRELFGTVGLDSVYIFDPADAVAREVVDVYGREGKGKTMILASAESESFNRRSTKFLSA